MHFEESVHRGGEEKDHVVMVAPHTSMGYSGRRKALSPSCRLNIFTSRSASLNRCLVHNLLLEVFTSRPSLLAQLEGGGE